MNLKIIVSRCSFFFIATSLLAQGVSLDNSSAGPSATSQVVHVGKDNFYSLGTKENPVTANEYCSFLNSTFDAIKDNSEYDLSDGYNDSSFMNKDGAGDMGGHTACYSTDCITRHGIKDGNGFLYSYSVVQGRGDYIIDGLSYWFSGLGDTQTEIQEAFNDWRKDPTALELSSYVSAKVMLEDDQANAIKSYYPDAANYIFPQLDLLAAALRGNGLLCQKVLLKDEMGRSIMNFTIKNNSFVGQGSIIIFPDMELDRPSKIMIEQQG